MIKKIPIQPEWPRWRRDLATKVNSSNTTMKALSLKAGLGETFVRDAIKRGREPSAAKLEALLQALDSPAPSEKAEGPQDHTANRRIPLLGHAAGAITREATIEPEPIDLIAPPPAVADIRGLYALRVTGTSMAPRWDDDDVILIDPNRRPRPGDCVVIRERRGGRETALLKRLVATTETGYRLSQFQCVANQSVEITVPQNDDTTVHRVLTNNDILGA